jgi:hypothetical protein
MNTLKFTNPDIYGKPKTVILNDKDYYNRINYVSQYTSYITINGENYA